VSSFSVGAGSRLDALALQRHLALFSPWLVELRRGEWYVQGSLRGHSVADLEREVAVWSEERHLPATPVEVVHGSPSWPDDTAA
jgi:hypothetical protein